LVSEVVVVTFERSFDFFKRFASSEFTVKSLLEVGNGVLVVELEVCEFTVAFFFFFKLVL